MRLTPSPLRQRAGGGALAAAVLAFGPALVYAQSTIVTPITSSTVSPSSIVTSSPAPSSTDPYIYDPWYGAGASSTASPSPLDSNANDYNLTDYGTLGSAATTESANVAATGTITESIAASYPASPSQTESAAAGVTTVPSADPLPVPDLGFVSARTAFDYTVPAFSPMLSLFPVNLTTVDAGWSLSFTQVSWDHYTNRSLANGTATIASQMENATMSLPFVGSGISIKGVINGSITLTVQNQYYGTAQSGDPYITMIYYGDGTVNGTDQMTLVGDVRSPSQYNATITVNANSSFVMETITVSAPLGGYGSRGTRGNPILMLDPVDNYSIPSDVKAIGQWEPHTDFCATIWNDTAQSNQEWCDQTPYAYPVLKTSSENARLQFTAPQNTSLFTVLGTIGMEYGMFQVGTQEFYFDDNSAKYSAQSPWLKPGVPLYTGALDPRKINTINIDFFSDYPYGFDVYQVMFILAVGGQTDYVYIPSSTGGAPSRLGRTIGGIVGGVVGFLLLLAGLLWFYVRRRRRMKRAAQEPDEKQSPSKPSRRRAVGQTLARESDSLSVFEVDESSSSNEALGTIVTPLPLPGTTTALPQTHNSADSGESTIDILERKLREAREAASKAPEVSQRSTSPTRVGTSTGPPRLPPLKLSLLTGSLVTGSSPRGVESPVAATPLTPASGSPHVPLGPFPLDPRNPAQQRTVTEEEDAGRLPAVVEETIPPRYNPAWADEYAATGTVVDSAAGTLVASGPSTLSEMQMRGARLRTAEEVLRHSSDHLESPTDSIRPLVNSERFSGQVSSYDSETPSPHSEVGPSVVRKSEDRF